MPHPPITTIISRLKMTTAGIVTPAGKRALKKSPIPCK